MWNKFSGDWFSPNNYQVEQMHKIFKLCGSPSEEYWRKSKLPHATSFKPQHPYKRCVAETFKDIPSSALDLINVLLTMEPEDRGSASSALKSEVILRFLLLQVLIGFRYLDFFSANKINLLPDFVWNILHFTNCL